MKFPKLAVPKFLNREVTIRLTNEGFVSRTRRARFFSTSDSWHLDLTPVHIAEAAGSGSLAEAAGSASLMEMPRNDDQK